MRRAQQCAEPARTSNCHAPQFSWRAARLGRWRPLSSPSPPCAGRNAKCYSRSDARPAVNWSSPVAVLTIEAVAVSFGAVDVLQQVSAEAQPGDRIGLVGRNGAGKSSLLRVLAGAEQPSAGRKQVERGAKVALVEQTPVRRDSPATVRQEAVSALSHVLNLTLEMEQAAESLARARDPAEYDAWAERYAQLLERLETQAGFDYESEMSRVLIGLGLPESSWQQTVSSLSGGQRGRLELAKALLSRPDVLLMDEPTNNLDLRGLQWLEGFLNRWPGTVIVASHDRYFLDAVASRIWHIDFGRLKAYPGNYSKFEELRSADVLRRQKEVESQKEFIAKEEEFIRRYGAGQRAREARGREKRLSRLERLEAPQQSRSAGFKLSAKRSGDIVLRSRDLSVGYSNNSLLDIGELDLFRGERVALIGPNGAGKSTLLKTIAEELPPTRGSIQRGAALDIAHFWQEAENLDANSTVIEDLLRDSTLEIQQARNLLGHFLFRGDDVDKKVSMLSGGERSRLALVKLVVSGANLLLLDEPTNHLDIPAREALEDALDGFPGTLVFASHDRRLIARIATRLWVIEGSRLVTFEGTLDEYDAANPPAPRTDQPQADKGPAPEKPPLSNNRAQERRRKILELEQAIERLQIQLGEIGDQINDASEHGEPARVTELGGEYQAKSAKLDRLLEEWAEIAE